MFFALLGVLTGQAFSAPSPHIWQRWDYSLTSAKAYQDPYRNVTVQVTYKGPAGVSFKSWAFWEKGNIFRIRAAFPAAGTWTWRTSCSDKTNKGLHHKSGQVLVSAYEGNNPLYRNGFLKVAAGERTLAYADDTPFLWMGDTGWYVLRESSSAEWRRYIDNRAAKGFTVVQVHVGNSWVIAPDVDGHMPFENYAPSDDFWSGFEEKISYANDQGIVVYLIGLGASGKGGYLPAMNTREFARYITGRFAGHFVIFSPSMDAHYDKRNDELGAYLKEADPRHLVSQHVGTDLHAAEEYHSRQYMDFTSLQSGHHGGNVEEAYAAARNWSLALWRKTPVKPVINAEGMYDGRGNNEGSSWREMDVRKIGWMSWLSGALGYTYGAGNTKNVPEGDKGGVWMLNRDKRSYDYWERAMEWNSAKQMTYLRDFFQSIDWWRLEPAPELMLNQPEDPVRLPVVAKSKAGDLLVAYLPDDTPLELNLAHLTETLQGTWYNPVTGEYSSASRRVRPGIARFTPPGPGDWTLLLIPRDK